MFGLEEELQDEISTLKKEIEELKRKPKLSGNQLKALVFFKDHSLLELKGTLMAGKFNQEEKEILDNAIVFHRIYLHLKIQESKIK